VGGFSPAGGGLRGWIFLHIEAFFPPPDPRQRGRANTLALPMGDIFYDISLTDCLVFFLYSRHQIKLGVVFFIHLKNNELK